MSITQNTLVIPYDYNTLSSGLTVTPCGILIALAIGAFCMWYGLHHYLLALIISILALISIMLAIGLYSSIYILKTNEPLAVLDESGFWLGYYGKIPWENIEKVASYKSPSLPTPYITLTVKDLDSIWNQSSISGRIHILISRYYDQTTTVRTNITCGQDDILRYAQQHIARYDRLPKNIQ